MKKHQRRFSVRLETILLASLIFVLPGLCSADDTQQCIQDEIMNGAKPDKAKEVCQVHPVKIVFNGIKPSAHGAASKIGSMLTLRGNSFAVIELDNHKIAELVSPLVNFGPDDQCLLKYKRHTYSITPGCSSVFQELYDSILACQDDSSCKNPEFEVNEREIDYVPQNEETPTNSDAIR